MRIAEWIERLRSETSLEVKGAAELAAAKADQLRDTAFVAPLDEAALSQSDTIGAVRQMVRVGVGVTLAVTNRRDRRGEAAVSEIEGAREDVRRALLGWTPPSASGPAGFRRGRLVQLSERTAWWTDEYECDELVAAAA